jgi:hypothetical protein
MNKAPSSSCKAAVVLTVWTASVAWCDTESAVFLRYHNACTLVAGMSVIGSLFGALVSAAVPSTTPPFHFARNILAVPHAFESRLLLALAAANTAALVAMFYAVSIGGMPEVYALKTTEPICICLLSVTQAQAVIKRTVMLGAASGHSLEEWHWRRPSYPMWCSVVVVCVGAMGIATSMKAPNFEDHRHRAVGVGALLVTLSNVLLALRTMLQKPMLHALLKLETIVAASTKIFVEVGAIGGFFLIAVMLATDQYDDLRLTMGDLYRLFSIAVSYYVYQVCNSLVILYVVPVSYSVVKQLRVVIIFFLSVSLFGKEFDSVAQLVVGLVLVSVGSVWYAHEQASQDRVADCEAEV